MRTVAFSPGLTSCVSARTARKGWIGSTSGGNFEFTTLPSTCSTVTGHPATPLSGCSTTKPVRAVRKSVFGTAMPSNSRSPLAWPSILASYAISWPGRLHTAWNDTEKPSARWSISNSLILGV